MKNTILKSLIVGLLVLSFCLTGCDSDDGDDNNNNNTNSGRVIAEQYRGVFKNTNGHYMEFGTNWYKTYNSAGVPNHDGTTFSYTVDNNHYDPNDIVIGTFNTINEYENISKFKYTRVTKIGD